VKNQKLDYKEGNLSQERIARLEEIEFDWNIEDKNEANVEDRSRKKWKDRQEEMIEQLKAFKEQHGRIPLYRISRISMHSYSILLNRSLQYQ
jgi:hypothetical protein